jgi:hypothetical protein
VPVDPRAFFLHAMQVLARGRARLTDAASHEFGEDKAATMHLASWLARVRPPASRAGTLHARMLERECADVCVFTSCMRASVGAYVRGCMRMRTQMR